MPATKRSLQLAPAGAGDVCPNPVASRCTSIWPAPSARGLEIDWVEDVRGAGLVIRNPNAPPPVKSISVRELHDRIAAGSIDVIDIRPAQARAVAPFPPPHEVLDEGTAPAWKRCP